MELPLSTHNRLPRVALVALLCSFLFSCKMPNDPMNDLPRNQSLPKFNPHMPTFTCEVEATKVPTIDAEADAWFLEARALEAPDTLAEERDYKK